VTQTVRSGGGATATSRCRCRRPHRRPSVAQNKPIECPPLVGRRQTGTARPTVNGRPRQVRVEPEISALRGACVDREAGSARGRVSRDGRGRGRKGNDALSNMGGSALLGETRGGAVARGEERRVRGTDFDTVLLAKEREEGGKKTAGMFCILTLLGGV